MSADATELLDPAPPSDGNGIDPPDDGDDDGGGGEERPIRWRTVAAFSTSAEAHVARLRLEAHDIVCFIADENVVSMAWHYSLATGGIKLQVDEADVPRALELLASRADALDDGAAIATDDAYGADRCPHCGSPRIARDGFTLRRVVGIGFLTAIALSMHWLFAGLLLSACVLLIVRSAGWRCGDCGNQWDLRRGFTMIPTAKLAAPRLPPPASPE